MQGSIGWRNQTYRRLTLLSADHLIHFDSLFFYCHPQNIWSSLFWVLNISLYLDWNRWSYVTVSTIPWGLLRKELKPGLSNNFSQAPSWYLISMMPISGLFPPNLKSSTKSSASPMKGVFAPWPNGVYSEGSWVLMTSSLWRNILSVVFLQSINSWDLTRNSLKSKKFENSVFNGKNNVKKGNQVCSAKDFSEPFTGSICSHLPSEF